MTAREAARYRASLGATEDAEGKLDRILKNQEEDARRRRIAVVWAAVGALFAAGRLGILAVPLVKARRARR